MAASGTCLQVLTASNLIYYAVHNEQILWNIYLEATEEKKELTWARIADICGLNKHVAVIIMSSSSSSIFNCSLYIFVNFVKFVCKLSVGVTFPHTINSSAIFTTNEQVVANFLTCFEELGDVANKSARKLRGS